MSQIERIVDAHMHLWDPARTDWYPYLSGGRELNMGDISRMCRFFDETTYFAESARWPVEKIVHVAAADSAFSAAETAELDLQAERSGHPDAIIGGLVVCDITISEVEALLDAQTASPRFRGVRPMGGVPAGAIPNADILGPLRERELILHLRVHPDELQEAAVTVAKWPDLSVVIEHAGWPRSDTRDEFRLWKTGMTAIAAASQNVTCTLSGLAMPLGSMEPTAFKPWIDHCLETFGVDRCMFASNFPVDGVHGTFDELYATYDTLTAGLDAESRDLLFAGNAERIYGC